MSTVTTHETHALDAAAPAQNLILVPLSQLRPSKRNVRKTVGASITALAASIQRVGLLQKPTLPAKRSGWRGALAGCPLSSRRESAAAWSRRPSKAKRRRTPPGGGGG